MIRYARYLLLVLLALVTCRQAVMVPVETEFSLLNLSERWYAVFELRPTLEQGQIDRGHFPLRSDLLPPGAIFRRRFLDEFPETGGCPDGLDVRVYLYKRVHEDTPVGEDPGEEVFPGAIASAQFVGLNGPEERQGLAVCRAPSVLPVYTIVLRDSAEGHGVFVAAQDVRHTRRVFVGTELPDLDVVPDLPGPAPVAGRVLTAVGSPVAGIGVLLRTRLRVDLEDEELLRCCFDGPNSESPFETMTDGMFRACCLSSPIAITATNDEGRFYFERPPGAYFVEAFADGFVFRPVGTQVESPIDNITIIAEPQP